MLAEREINNTIQKCSFYVRESNKQLEDIKKSFARLNNMYRSKTRDKFERKIDSINAEANTINKNNENFIEVLRKTVIGYREATKSYEKSFEELGENVK